MSLALVALVGVLTAVGTYLLLNRTLTRIILGIGLLGNAINLMVVASGGPPGRPPIVGDGDGAVADPVPQALVLTAIVITFGVIAFLLAVAYRSWTIDGNDEVEDDIEDRRLARAPVERDADAAPGATPDAGEALS